MKDEDDDHEDLDHKNNINVNFFKNEQKKQKIIKKKSLTKNLTKTSFSTMIGSISRGSFPSS